MQVTKQIVWYARLNHIARKQILDRYSVKFIGQTVTLKWNKNDPGRKIDRRCYRCTDYGRCEPDSDYKINEGWRQ